MEMLLRGLTMPRPIPVPIRQAMFRLWKQGRATRQIADSLGLPLLYRSPSPSAVSAPRSRRPLARLSLPSAACRPSEPVQTAMRLPRAPHLGGWPDPCAARADGRGTARPLRTNPPTLV